MKATDPPGTPGMRPIDASPEAQEAFLRLLEASPADPLAGLPSLGLEDSVGREVARIVDAYLRARRLESDLSGPGGEVASALAALGAEEIPPASRAIPERIGADDGSHGAPYGALYDVLDVISSGPRSAVVRARQREPIDREVAVKILFDDARDPEAGPAVAARAELERQILATLEHPNVARLYDSGIDHLGRPYFVMELVRGGRLTDWCRTSGRTLHDRIRVFLGAVEALRYAHGCGVLHRDLKPDNVLVQIIDGEPHCRLIDFGIALGLPGARERETLLREQGGLDAGSFVGTLRSMSPESLDPSRPRFDVRSDVFGLGLVLFEVACGRGPRARPSQGAGTPDELARAVAAAVEGKVPRLRDVDRAMPAQLDAIVARACAPNPEDRYQSVAELHDDLLRLLRGDEVLAHPEGVGRRLLRTLRRRPALAVLCVGALLATSAGLALQHGVDRRVGEAVARANGLLEQARAIREVAGTAPRRESLGLEAMDAAAGALGLRPGDAGLLALRADAVEEVVLPRLARNDHRSPRTSELVEELVGLREQVVAARAGDPLALERLSRALAYELDVTRGTPRFDLVEARQLALDEELARAHPSVLRFADNLCWTLQRASDHAWTRGDRVRALLLMRAAVELGDELVARDPERAISHLTASMTSTLAASLALLEDDLDAALAAATTAVARAVDHLRLQPESVSGAAQLLKAAALEGRILRELDRHVECGERLDAAIAIAAGPLPGEVDRFLDGRPLGDLLKLRFDVALATGDVESARRALEALELEVDRDEALPATARIRMAGLAERSVWNARLLIAEGARDRAIEIALGLVASESGRARSEAATPLLALIDEIDADGGLETQASLIAWRMVERERLAELLMRGEGVPDGVTCAEVASATGALVGSLLSEKRFEDALQALEILRDCEDRSLDAALSLRALERVIRRAVGSLIPAAPAAPSSPPPLHRAR